MKMSFKLGRVRRSIGHTCGILSRVRLISVFFAVLGVLAISTHAAGQDVGGKRDFTVYQQNAYVGVEYDRVLAVDPSDPTFPFNLFMAVTETYYGVLGSRPDLRMDGIAAEIAAHRPDAVLLQEAMLIRTQSPGDAALGNPQPATAVAVDYLALVLYSLAQRGASYQVAAVSEEIDIEMPMFNQQGTGLDDVRLTDREVILVRADLPPGYLRLSNFQRGTFQQNLIIPTMGIVVKRGWCSVDVFTRGRSFRLINAHLEEETQPEIQLAQGLELLQGPAKTALPVILGGDFNSDGNRQSGTQTYDAFLSGGFSDPWAQLHPNLPGLTWGHDAWLADPNQGFVWRLDMVLYRGARMVPVTAEVRDLWLGRDSRPLWASDHAGLLTSFRLE